MPNLFTEIISKTGSAYVQSISGVSAVTEIVSDAKSVRDSIMKVPDNAKGVYRGIRQGGFKKITDWFLERGDEFGMNSTLDESGDDFDAGFKYGSDDSGESSKVLDADGMKDIARGQVSAMYNIAGKQAEATAMSASEVISSMNNRSSEILSSLGNINSSLTTISEKLESIISLQKSAQEGNQNGANGFYDENGNLTYRSVFAGGKNYLMNMLPVTDLQSLKQLGTISSVVSMLASKINEKQFSFLGDRSINEVSEDFSERLLNVQNKAFTKLFSTDFFQTIFGNQLLTGGKKDYSSYIESDYTKDKAVFDGMTRKSIVDIIPGYLKKITEAVTGQTWHVNQYGNLSQTRDVDDFKQVLSASIKDGFSDRALNSIIKAGADQSIPAEDIRRAQRCLMSMYTGYAMTELQTRLSSDLFENGGDPRVNRETAQILAQSSGKSLEHWVAVIALIDSNLQNDSNMRESFIRAVNANMVAMDKQAQEYAMNHPNADNVGEFEFEDFKKTIAEHLKFLNESNIEEDLTYQEMIDRNIITKEQLPTGAKLDERRSEYELRKREIDKMKQSEVVANIGVSFKQFRETTLDYLYSIFDILNRGINVHNTGKKPFPKMDIKKAKFDVPSATNNITSTGDGDSGNRASTASRSTDDTGSDTGTDAQSTDGESTDGESTEGTGTTSVVNTEEQQQSSQSTTEVKPATPGQNLANATRDLVETVTNPIKNEWGYLKEDFTDFTDSFTEAGRKRQAERAGRTARQQKADWAEESKLRRDVADMNTDSESAEKDKATCDRVFSLLQTTATNGGDLAKAQSDINSEINQIEDAQLRSRMQTMVNKSFQRMNRETGSPAKSKIGKVLLWGFGLIKSFVKPILSAAKTFLGKFGKGLVAPLIKLMAKGVAGGTKKIVSGAKAVKEAIGTRARYVKAGEGEQHDIWGYATTTEVLRNEDGSFQLDKNGNIKTKTRRIKEDEGSGLLQLLSPILQMRKDLIKLPFKLTGVILKGTGKLIKGLSKRVKIIGANVKLGFSIVSEKIGNKFKGWFGDI